MLILSSDFQENFTDYRRGLLGQTPRTNPFLRNSVFPYVFTYNGAYYMAYGTQPETNIYLATSTDGAHWGQANSGNPIFTSTTTTSLWYHAVFNPGIAVVGNTWYLFQEGEASGVNFKLGFSSSVFSNNINFNVNVTSYPIISDYAGNPYLTCVPDRNALLAVYGDVQTGTWQLKASYAYLTSNLRQVSSWIKAPRFGLSVSGIHIADPTMVFNTGTFGNFGFILQYNYNQRNGYQINNPATLDQFFDVISVHWLPYWVDCLRRCF